MAERAIQVVKLEGTHTYTLDLEALKKVLERDDIRNLPVVVVSVVGAFRSGKSFLLNYLLRYLKSTESAREDGSWLDNTNALRGFSWRGGSERHTTGILVWSEPIICTNKAGEKMAIILMDTQGTFDTTNSARDNSIIVAISTLLSSIQLFNISLHVKEDDLEFLQLFTEYGKLVTEGGTQKPFQTLEFLIRDWMCPYEYSYGAEGGKVYIKNKLEAKPNQPKEIQDVHRYIQSSFETITGFLMPHPGFGVLNPKFDGNINGLSPEFKSCLKELASSLFGAEQLNPKQIGGTVVKAQELCTYFQKYMGLFNSEQLPTPTSIMTATSEANLQVASIEARAVYENEMQVNCHQSMSSLLLHTIHRAAIETARNTFINRKKLVSVNAAEVELEKLTKKLDVRLANYSSMNETKTLQLMDKANEAYDNYITKTSKGKPFCVPPHDVRSIHRTALDNAKAIFQSNRKLSNPDMEMEEFFKTFDEKLSDLKKINNLSNRMFVNEARSVYLDDMNSKVNWKHVSKEEMSTYHLSAAEHAMEHLEASRIKSHETGDNNRQNDTFKNHLIEYINITYHKYVLLLEANSKGDYFKEERDRNRRQEKRIKEEIERTKTRNKKTR